MGRPRLNVERTTVHLSPGTRQRIDKLVRNYGASEFIRDLVDHELDRLEQDSVGAAQNPLTGSVASGSAAGIRPPSEQQVPTPVGPATMISPHISDHRARASWRSMRQNSRETGYPIVAEWNDFSVFEKDMGPKPTGAILVRRDQRRGWGPDNCKWGTKAEVNQNRPTNSPHTIDGQTKISAEWARSAKMNASTFRVRVNKLGWSAKKAIETPVLPAPAPGPWKIKRRSTKNLMPCRKKDSRYKLWKDMRRRCRMKDDAHVPEWGEFWIFCRDLGERPSGAVLVRRDTSKPYGPANCSWGTKGDVSRLRPSVRGYSYGGLKMTVPALAQVAGIRSSTLDARLRKGMPLEQALAPVVKAGPR